MSSDMPARFYHAAVQRTAARRYLKTNAHCMPFSALPEAAFGVEYGFMFVDTHVGRAGAFERHGGDAAQLLHDLGQVEHRNADATLDLLAAGMRRPLPWAVTPTAARAYAGLPAYQPLLHRRCRLSALRSGHSVPQNHRDSGNGRLCIPHGTVTLNPSRETTAVPERECIEFTIELLRPGHLVGTVVILPDRSERIDGMRILNELSVTDDSLNCGAGRRYTDQVYVPAAVQTFELLNRLKIRSRCRQRPSSTAGP